MSRLPFFYRLLIPIISSIVAGFLILDALMVSTVDEHYGQAAITGARNSLAEKSERLKAEVNEGIQVAQTLARALESLTHDPLHFNENAIMKVLWSLQEQNSDIFYGVWANWLPGEYPAAVSASASYINDGHFAPMAFPSKDGGIRKVTTTGHSGNDEKSLWFTEPVRTGKLYITEPTTYSINGNDVNLITIGFPLKNGDHVIGVAGVNMDVGYVQEMIDALNFQGMGYAFLITDEMKYFAHPDRSLIGKNALEDFSDLKNIRSSQEENIYIDMDGHTGKESEFIFKPITFKNSEEVIILGMVIPENELYAFVGHLSVQAKLIALLSILVISAVVFHIIRQMVNKIGGEPEDVIARVTQVAKGDLSAREPLGRKVRKDSLSCQVDMMTRGLANLIEQFRKNSSCLDESSKFLTQASGELLKSTDMQSQSSSQVAAASVEMTQTIKEIAQDLIEMAEYAKETGSKAQEGEKVVEVSTAKVVTIKTAADDSTESVNALMQSSDKIRDIVNVISAIAEQTNLLALNAAIEAARAGEQGRGFAVVADEVRGLASRTQKATYEISELVNSTHQDVESVTQSMDQVSSQVSTGVELSNQVSKSLSLIVQSVDSLEGRLGGVSSATSEMAVASGEVEKNINSVASHSESVNQVASEISGQAGQLRDMSASIHELVSHFKL